MYGCFAERMTVSTDQVHDKVWTILKISLNKSKMPFLFCLSLTLNSIISFEKAFYIPLLQTKYGKHLNYDYYITVVCLNRQLFLSTDILHALNYIFLQKQEYRMYFVL